MLTSPGLARREKDAAEVELEKHAAAAARADSRVAVRSRQFQLLLRSVHDLKALLKEEEEGADAEADGDGAE